MMTVFDASFIPGVMLGIEFPSEPEGAIVVLDLLILRLVIWRITEEDLPQEEKAP